MLRMAKATQIGATDAADGASRTTTEGVLTLSRKDAIAELWRRNRQSSHLLRPYQRDMRDRARTPKGKKYFSLCSRRIGKTTTAIVTADELA